MQAWPAALALTVFVSGCTEGGESAKGGTSKGRNIVAKLEVDIYDTGFLMWARANPAKKCPESLADLGQYTSDKDTKDVWGNELVMLCGESAPAEARGFGVLSMGADGKLDTADDIKSWGPLP